MSLGRKLANYRKLAGLTQQQLGEELNLSPQAISKWENDLAEPDLATLRTLSNLYNVPIGEMIDPNIRVTEPCVEEPQVSKGNDKEIELKTEVIGFCKNCGITVTDLTIGEKDPVILCKKCCEKRDNDQRIANRNEALKREEETAAIKKRHSKKLKSSLIVSGIAALLFLVVMIAVIVKTSDYSLIPVSIVGVYVVFAYVACLFYECVVSELFFDWTSKSFQFPSLIFTFDLDGVAWLIGMKLLFWALGIALGLLCASVGITLGLICAPVVFPFVMSSMRKAILTGTECKYI